VRAERTGTAEGPHDGFRVMPFGVDLLNQRRQLARRNLANRANNVAWLRRSVALVAKARLSSMKVTLSAVVSGKAGGFGRPLRAARLQHSGELDLEIDRPDEGVATGDHERACAISSSSSARGRSASNDTWRDVGEADGLFRQVAGAPHGGDVEIAFQLDLKLEHRDAARHGVGVNADREAGAERGKRSLGRVRRGVVAEQTRRFIDHVSR